MVIGRPPTSRQRGRAQRVFVKYDTASGDLAERFMERVLGRPFIRYGRAGGFELAKSEFDALKAAAAASGWSMP